MSKGLRALDIIANYQVIIDYEKDETSTIQEQLPNSCNIIENELKALDIIKEKRVDITTLMDCCNAEEYNRWVHIRSHYSYRPFELTQEEFDSLKKIFYEKEN